MKLGESKMGKVNAIRNEPSVILIKSSIEKASTPFLTSITQNIEQMRLGFVYERAGNTKKLNKTWYKLEGITQEKAIKDGLNRNSRAAYFGRIIGGGFFGVSKD
jgi:hypothetical protein